MRKPSVSLVFGAMLFSSASLAGDARIYGIIKLLSPLKVTVVKNLSFGTHIKSGKKRIKVSPQSSMAAQFGIEGTRYKSLKINIPYRKIMMYHEKNKGLPGIIVRDFKIGGLTHGLARLDKHGRNTNLTIGASADINDSHRDGNYIGKATIRVIYY